MTQARLRVQGSVLAILGVVALVSAGTAPTRAVQAPATAGQTAQEQARPIFRAGATFVNVDAYPRRDGKLVEGLTAADFEIFEDGKPQPVESFEFIRVDPTTPDAERRDPSTAEEGDRLAADPHNRVFVVYLDIYHVTFIGARDSRRPILDFLSRAIGPSDLFGVLTPETPVKQLTFGRRLETIEGELTRNSEWGIDTRDPRNAAVRARSAPELELLKCGMGNLIPLLRQDTLFSSLEALVSRLGALRDERKSILMLTGTWVPARGNRAIVGSGQPPPVGIGPGGRIGIGATQQREGGSNQYACDTLANRLGSIDFEQRFRELLQQSRRANVSFFPIDTEGLRVESNMAGTDTLRTLAENTDGIAVVNTNDLDTPVKKIADVLSGFYLLGYYSTNSAADGRFRQIEVKVKQKDVKVSARRGYLAPTADMRRAELAAATRPVTGPSPVDLELGRLARTRADATVNLAGARAGDGLDVVVEIASREVDAGRWKSGGAVTVIVAGDAGNVSATGRIDAGARSSLVHVALGATPGAGPWRVQALVTGDDGKLDERGEIAAPSQSGLSDPQVFRATPSPRAVPRPVADFQFRRNERLHVEWTSSMALDERLARLLDRKGNPLPIPVTVTERLDGDRRVLVADLLLAPLPEGDFVVEVTAGPGGKTEKAYLAFRIVR